MNALTDSSPLPKTPVVSVPLFDCEARDNLVADKSAISEAFSKAALTYDQHAQFQRDVADWLLSHLAQDLSGKHYLDVGCGTGYVAKALIELGAQVTCVDISAAMLAQAKLRIGEDNASFQLADAEALPFAQHSFDGVVSSLALQWCEDLRLPLSEIKRVLKPSGFGFITTLGHGSLQELRQAWSNIDSHQHVNAFCDLNHIKVALEQISTASEPLHCRKFVTWYDSALALMKDLKGIGATHVEGRAEGLTSRATLRRLEQQYQQFAQPQGLPATYQVCLGIV